MFLLKSDAPILLVAFGVILLLIIVGIMAIVNNVKEKNRRKKLLTDIEEALSNDKVLRNHYDEIKSGFNKYKTDYSISLFSQAKKHKEKYDFLHNKYTNDVALKLFNHQYWIGMTIEQLIDAKGQPDKVEDEVLKTKTKKILIYGNKSSGDVFNFVEGVLERFKDR